MSGSGHITGTSAGETHCAAPLPRRLRRDLKTLAMFVQVYCDGQHADRQRLAFESKSPDVTAVCRRPVHLCGECRKLLTHAWVKRCHCPMDPKPACRDCPEHCYASAYRDQMRAVMRYSGMRLLLRGRLHYLIHLLF